MNKANSLIGQWKLKARLCDHDHDPTLSFSDCVAKTRAVNEHRRSPERRHQDALFANDNLKLL